MVYKDKRLEALREALVRKIAILEKFILEDLNIYNRIKIVISQIEYDCSKELADYAETLLEECKRVEKHYLAIDDEYYQDYRDMLITDISRSNSTLSNYTRYRYLYGYRILDLNLEALSINLLRHINTRIINERNLIFEGKYNV